MQRIRIQKPRPRRGKTLVNRKLPAEGPHLGKRIERHSRLLEEIEAMLDGLAECLEVAR
jgi:hypothetical protein